MASITKIHFFYKYREPHAQVRFLRKSNVIEVVLTGKESDEERVAIVRDVVAFAEKEGLTLALNTADSITKEGLTS